MGFLGGVRRLLDRPTSPGAGGGVRGIVWRGVLGLFRASAPSVCPGCDTPLPAELAKAPAAQGESPPRCPACEQPLVPLRVAGLWRRAAAGLLDGVVLLLTAGLLNLLVLSWLDPPPLLGDARGLDRLFRVLELDPLVVLRRIAPALAMAALYLGLFWTLTGQTLGHRLLRLRVVDPWGKPPRPWRAAVRVLGHGLGLALGAMGWLWVAFDREKRGLHDHLARTYVVRES
jgi:uncharacterized RDD family membrane protein YckC